MSARFVTWLGNDEATVDLVAREDDHVVATVQADEDADLVEMSFDYVELGGGAYQVLLADGRVVTGRVLGGLGGADRDFAVTMGAQRASVTALAERDAWLTGGASSQDEGMVKVSMPGRVVKVLVAEGEAVAERQPVLIIEAMKMENEVKAGRAGVVKAIRVAEGESVEADFVLIEIADE
jgi:biotin carboxyl carrier protein